MDKLRQDIGASALTAVERDGETCSRRYRFRPDFLGFGGHFPDYAIVPGIVQIMTGVDLFETAQGRAFELRNIENARFMLQLRPEMEIRVRCVIQDKGETWLAQFTLEIADGVASTFGLRFAKE